ncbi:MAG: sodium:solute symporter [Acidobacteria bacterium]|nr:sodium:solute symporter [Acidobacteriota bacterium]
MHAVDYAIVLLYMVGMAWIGLRFSRKQTTTEAYFVAGRAIPSWAVGMSIMATMVSSVTFIAYPGSSYAGDWSLLVPGFLLLIVLAIAGKVIIPFYREAVGMSVYEYFGKRFGTPVRMYGSIAFSLGHFGKMGFVYYLVALTANSMTGWNLDAIIIAIGIITVCYTLIGGIEAVIWTEVVQGIVKWIGTLIALGYLLFLPPGGPGAVFSVANAHNKFSLGSMDWDFSKKTIPVLVLYGFFWYLQRYCADQTLVQRYLVAKSDKKALKGVAMGALLTLPVWALFMLVGTSTWAFYRLTGEGLPAYITKADQIFPHFLSTHIPMGMAGLFMASLLAAAMSTLASDLNCIALVGVEDIYRHVRPQCDDQQRLRMGKILVAVFGVLGVTMAEILAHANGSALSMWFTVSAVLSGGLAGLFLLAFFSRRANARGVYVGIAACIAFTLWATATGGKDKFLDLGAFNYPWDDLTIGAVAHVVLWIIGYAASWLLGSGAESEFGSVTVWRWLKSREQQQSA